MTHTINWNMTVVEAANLAIQQGYGTFAEWIGDHSDSWPKRPEGYTLPRRSEYRWVGPEIVHSRFILTPVWDARTDTHSVDVWMADHQPPNYANLSPSESTELATALMTIANTLQGYAASNGGK